MKCTTIIYDRRCDAYESSLIGNLECFSLLVVKLSFHFSSNPFLHKGRIQGEWRKLWLLEVPPQDHKAPPQVNEMPPQVQAPIIPTPMMDREIMFVFI